MYGCFRVSVRDIRMVFYAIGCVLLVTQAVMCQPCFDLVLGVRMHASNLTAEAGDPPVNVTCDAGYKFDTDQLVTYLECNVTGYWNDTLGSCVKKECPDISLSLLPGIETTAWSNTTYSFGDTVTASCNTTGHAFSVNMSKPINSRATSSKLVTCQDDPDSTNATWGNLGVCSVIDCGTPPDITNAHNNFDNVTYGAEVTYRCHAGYYTMSGRWGSGDALYTVTAVCNDTATWMSDVRSWRVLEEDDLPKCTRLQNSYGCVDLSCFNISLTSDAAGAIVDSCVQFCRENFIRYAAIGNGTCYCGESEPTCANQPASSCDNYCAQFDPITSNATDPIFCGGPGGLASFYYSYQGYQYGLSTCGISFEEVVGDKSTTCRERCRVKDATHAGLDYTICYCFNETDFTNDPGGCGSPYSLYIYDLAKYSLEGATCLDLFENGIRMYGYYYLSSPERIEECYFKDGTVCELGWVGEKGYCYYANMETKMNFNDASAFCRENGGELVSILNQEEQDFLNNYKTIFQDDMGNSTDMTWWLGMADGTVSESYMFTWLDGSLTNYTRFQSGKPNCGNCHCLAEDPIYGWEEDVCHAKKHVMCKKKANWSYCIALISPLVNTYEMTSSDMSLTYCLEICKGMELAYALVQNDTCTCTNTSAVGDPWLRTECATTCPGHAFQKCGNDSFYTYLKVSDKNNAHSCEELQLIGLGEADYRLGGPDNTSLQHCGDPTCPFGWLPIGTHCYKPILGTSSPTGSFDFCARSNAYGVVFETEYEMTELLQILDTTSMYAGKQYWRLGLYALSLNGGQFRWANGKSVNTSIWSHPSPNVQNPDVFVKSTSDNTLYTANIWPRIFICERGDDYIGCFGSVSGLTPASIASYYKMTIQLCVERCRADGHLFAYLTKHDCYCWSALTGALPADQCLTNCSGQQYQVCGGTGSQMSVYNVSDYPELAATCDDLADAGIFLAGDYIVNGSLINCDLIDGTPCSDPEWFGYQGNCYRHFPAEAARTRAEICHDNNATQASLWSTDEWDILAYFLRRIYLYSTFRVFTGITHGGYALDVFIGEDGLLVDPYLIDAGHLLPADLYDAQAYVSFRMNQGITFTQDGGVICKKKKSDVIGCFDKPASVNLVLESYGSVELAQCRQLCAVANHNVTLIGKDFCACVTFAEAAALTPPNGSCDEPCSIHKDQQCGDGTVVWAHQTVWGEVMFADNCKSLYKAGIFYNAPYLLEDANGTKTPEICGYSDNTSCPATMLGNNGECFKFLKAAATFTAAVDYCFSRDTYLFNPTNSTVNDFIDDFILTSDLLISVDQWHTGITPLFYDYSYVASTGYFVSTSYAGGTNKPHGNTGYDVAMGSWFEASGALPYICQTTDAYLGCQSIMTAAAAMYASTWNSMTMCIQWCHGQDMLYAATHLQTCACYVTLPNMTSDYGNCDTPCGPIAAQSCGGIASDGSELYSLMDISGELAVAVDCVQLYNYGVVQPGWYYVRSNASSPAVKVQCFLEDGPYQAVSEGNISSSSGTLSKAGYPHLNSRFNYPDKNVWKPYMDTSAQRVDFDLSEDRIITGILTAGLRSPEEVSYVTSVRLSYWEQLTGTQDVYSQGGITDLQTNCNVDSGVCLLYLNHPIITNKLSLTPRTWQQSIAVQALVYAQSAVEFDYNDNYIGCFLDPNNDFVNYGLADNLTGCEDLCKDNNYPFASLDEFGACLCGESGIENGRVDDTDCPLTAAPGNVTHRTSLNDRRAIYTTYVAVCSESDLPVLGNGSIGNVVFPYQAGVYTYATLVNYTCDEGYEHPDGSVSETIACQQNNQWTSLTQICQKIRCPVFTVTNGVVNIPDNQYKDRADFMCGVSFYANNVQKNMTVTCESDKRWSVPIPSCSVHNGQFAKSQFDIIADTLRNQTLLAEFPCRNRMDCAGKCNSEFFCMAANYKPTPGRGEYGTCWLFSTHAAAGDLETGPGWEYLDRFGIVLPGTQ